MPYKESLLDWAKSKYAWPDAFADFNGAQRNPTQLLDLQGLRETLDLLNTRETVYLSLLSCEYLHIGKLWIKYALEHQLASIVIIAADEETWDSLTALGIKTCRAFLPRSVLSGREYVSRTGFGTKALAVTALKFIATKEVLCRGLNTNFVDIDAILLRTPPPYTFQDIDIAFQRVLYLPEPTSRAWGFSACTGYVWLRSIPRVITFVNRVIELQEQIYDDQVAFNIALWELDVRWRDPGNHSGVDYLDIADRRDNFVRQAAKLIYGYSETPSIRILALPATTYWRNADVELKLEDAIVYHPNTPKIECEKLAILKSGLKECIGPQPPL